MRDQWPASFFPSAMTLSLVVGAAIAFSGCSGGAGHAVPSAASTPSSELTGSPAPTMTPFASTTSTKLALRLVVPLSAAGASPIAYLSPATQSISISFANTPAQVFTLRAGTDTCSADGSVLSCSLPLIVPAAGLSSVIARAFATSNAQGTPLAIATSTATSDATSFALAWKPVVVSLSTAIAGGFSAGVAASADLAITPLDAAGSVIPAGTADFVDVDGAPLTITLSDSDTSESTRLNTTTYSGAKPTIIYNGDLPLPNPISITAVAATNHQVVARSSSPMTQPTVSHTFSVTLGTAAVTAQNAVLNASQWYYVPDSKASVVPLANGSYQYWWGTGGALRSLGTGPTPELQRGTADIAYTPAQPWERAGDWFMNVFPVNHPYLTTDTQNLMALVHAESDYYGFHTKVAAVTYSHDGGNTWTPSQMILTPYGFPSLTSAIDACDCGATYDPVNKQWVMFFTAVDSSLPVNGGGLSIAISKDPSAAPGSWYKLKDGLFNQPGLGGSETVIAAFPGFTGGPTVSWNSYLNEWVMIMFDNEPIPGLYYATSPDLYTWTTPVYIMDGSDVGGTSAEYPTLIGDHGDKITGQTNTLYYGVTKSTDPPSFRRLYERSLTFTRHD